MTIIKLAAIVLDKLMRQKQMAGSSRPGIQRRTDDDTVMMHAMTERSTEEACRIRTLRLSIALTFTIFLRGVIYHDGSSTTTGGRARQKSGFFPRIKNCVCSRRKTRLVSARLLRAPYIAFFLPPCPSHAVLVLLAKFIRRWNGRARRCRMCWLDIQTAPLFVPLHRTVQKHKCTCCTYIRTVHRSN